MKIRKRELAKPGIYGTVDNPVVVTERDLKEIAETFPDVGKPPVSMGHNAVPEKPRLGRVINVTFDEATKTLSGEVEEKDALAAAVDEDYFPDCSIGARRRASDGKMYLHHLAYLGEQPPAIKTLQKKLSESIAADDGEGCVVFPSVNDKRIELCDTAALGGSNKNNKEHFLMDKNKKKINAADDDPHEPDGGAPDAAGDIKAANEKITALEAENAKLKEQLAKLAEQYPDAGIELADSDPRVSGIMAELRKTKREALLQAVSGKLPKAKAVLVANLADSLSIGGKIELADGEGKNKRSVSQIDLLTEIFSELPPLVRTGVMNLGDGDAAKPADLSGLMGCV